MSNISLWEAVCTTDPRYTKEFSRSGGFKGTAINPTYQIMKATEAFGPVGMGWGWRIEKEDYVPGAEGEVNHVVRLTLWYRITPKFVEAMQEAEPFLGQVCEVTHFGQTIYVGKNKYGQFTDEEAPKKSLTDAISKALSCLGFSADIHLGLFDSNKYVNDRRAEFVGEKTATPSKPKEPAKEVVKPGLTPEIRAAIVEFLPKIGTMDECRQYMADVCETTGIRSKTDPAGFAQLMELFNPRVAELKKTEAETVVS